MLLILAPTIELARAADQPPLPDRSHLLWNGDSDETSRIVQLGEVTDGGVNGKCLAATWPDSGKRINPVIVFGKSRRDVDLKGFDELWFFVKASESGKTFAVELRQWTGRMARVEIDCYLEHGKLTTDWQLARIPLADFQPNETWQGIVDHIIFNDVERTTSTRQNRALLPKKLFLDEMYLVKVPKEAGDR
jgi:hypothetical protein